MLHMIAKLPTATATTALTDRLFGVLHAATTPTAISSATGAAPPAL